MAREGMPSPLDPRRSDFSEGRCAACGGTNFQHAPGCENQDVAGRIARLTGKERAPSRSAQATSVAGQEEGRMNEFRANEALNDAADRNAIQSGLAEFFPHVPVQIELLDTQAVQRIRERVSAYKAMLELSPANISNHSAVEGLIMQEVTDSIKRGRQERKGSAAQAV